MEKKIIQILFTVIFFGVAIVLFNSCAFSKFSTVFDACAGSGCWGEPEEILGVVVQHQGEELLRQQTYVGVNK